MKSTDLMHPSDGWFTKIEQGKDKTAKLVLCLNIDDEPTEIATIQQFENVDEIKMGELIKKSIFVEGFAEYLNGGGTIREVASMLSIIELNMGFENRDSKPVIFDAWRYFNTKVNHNGNRVHEFIREDKQRYIRWVRNEYVDEDLTAKDMEDDGYSE
jgi:hypothetical protein